MNELDKLRTLLKLAKIPFEDFQELFHEDHREFEKMYGEASKYTRNQIIYGRKSPDDAYWKFDAVWQFGSHGAGIGLIETYGELGVDKDGEPRVMNAFDAFCIIAADYMNEKEKENND